jgi:hypothetical protein
MTSDAQHLAHPGTLTRQQATITPPRQPCPDRAALPRETAKPARTPPCTAAIIHVRDSATLKAVGNTPPDRRVDVVVIEPGRWHPGNLRRLIGRGEAPADHPACKAGIHGLAHLAVPVGDHVAGIAEHPDQGNDLDVQARFLPALADSAPGQRLVLLRPPVGIVHRPESGRRKSSKSPSLLRTITLADGLRLVGLGASGSCQ